MEGLKQSNIDLSVLVIFIARRIRDERWKYYNIAILTYEPFDAEALYIEKVNFWITNDKNEKVEIPRHEIISRNTRIVKLYLDSGFLCMQNCTEQI